jgi:lipopolysaccharide export system protein LptA
MNRVGSVLSVFLLVMAWVAPVLAEGVPTKITSENMEYAGSADTVVFSGRVHVTRENFELWSETLTVDLAPAAQGKATAEKSGAPGQGDIKKITATGSVRILSQGKEGFCGRAVYFADQGLVRMERDPRLKDGPNEITGEIINLYMRENRSEVVGGGKRVQAIFFTPAEKSEVP